jgi:hypothetical protein
MFLEYHRKTISQIAYKIVNYGCSFKDVLILRFEEGLKRSSPFIFTLNSPLYRFTLDAYLIFQISQVFICCEFGNLI